MGFLLGGIRGKLYYHFRKKSEDPFLLLPILGVKKTLFYGKRNFLLDGIEN